MKNVIQAEPMEEIENFIARLLVVALNHKQVVYGKFNRYIIVAAPCMEYKDLITQWGILTYNHALEREIEDQ